MNRAFKEFGTEHVPFKRFAANAAYYYLMAIAFFLFETFKQDIDSPLIVWISLERSSEQLAGRC